MRRTMVIVAGIILLASWTRAHHSYAEFLLDRTASVEGGCRLEVPHVRGDRVSSHAIPKRGSADQCRRVHPRTPQWAAAFAPGAGHGIKSPANGIADLLTMILDANS